MQIDELSIAARLLLLHVCNNRRQHAAAVLEVAFGGERSLRQLEHESGLPRSTLARRAGEFRAALRLSSKAAGLDPWQAAQVLSLRSSGRDA